MVPHINGLSKLIDLGCVPSIGMAGTVWHVSLIHKSAGPLLVALNGLGCSKEWDASEKNIHEKHRVLNVAMGEAIRKAHLGTLP
jgi:hypothetical protein